MNTRAQFRSESLDHIDRNMGLAFGALFALLMFCFFAAVAVNFTNIREKEHEQLSTTIASLVQESVSSVSFAGKHHLRGFIERLVSDNDNIAFIHVLDLQGAVIAGESDLKKAAHRHNYVQRRRVLQSQQTVSHEIDWQGERILEVSVPASTGFLNEPHVIHIGVRHPMNRRALVVGFLPVAFLWLLLLLIAIPAVRVISARIGGPVKTFAKIFTGVMEYAPLFIVVGNEKNSLLRSALFEKVFSGKKAQANSRKAFFNQGVGATTESFMLEMAKGNERMTLQGVRFDVGLLGQECYVGLDISEAESLRKETQELVFAIQNAAEQMWTTNPAGDVLWANDAALNAFGFSPEQMSQKNILELFSSENEAPELQELQESIALQIPYDGELVIASNAKAICEVRSSFFQAQDPQSKSNTFWVARDVTRELRLEEQLRQSQKMESIGKLAGGIAHDFNNLLTVINGVAAMELEMGSPSVEQIESLESILQAGHRAADLTSKMLTFSRQQVQRLAPVQLEEWVQETVPMLERLLPESIKLKFTFEENLPAVLADRSQLDQVLLNLVVNARDAMGEKGTLCISLFQAEKPVQLAHSEQKYWVYLQILDDGPGIDPKVLPRIFDPFFTTKGVGEGTGLGLSTVFGIAEQSGGILLAKNRNGKGAAFTFVLPATSQQEVIEPQKEARFASAQGQGLVLLVEDEKSVRETLEKMLQQRGFDVLSAESGADALEKISNNDVDFDLLLSDVLMPEQTGPELAEVLKAKGFISPVVFLSGYAPEDSRTDWPENAVFMSKPVQAAALMKTIFEVAPFLVKL